MGVLDLSEVREDEVDPVALAKLQVQETCHKIEVWFDPKQQCIRALWFKDSKDKDPQFVSWQFVQAVLGMAIEHAKAMDQQIQMQRMMAMQQAVQQQSQAANNLAFEINRRQARA